jgi:hypothetical protein
MTIRRGCIVIENQRHIDTGPEKRATSIYICHAIRDLYFERESRYQPAAESIPSLAES